MVKIPFWTKNITAWENQLSKMLWVQLELPKKHHDNFNFTSKSVKSFFNLFNRK